MLHDGIPHPHKTLSTLLKLESHNDGAVISFHEFLMAISLIIVSFMAAEAESKCLVIVVSPNVVLLERYFFIHSQAVVGSQRFFRRGESGREMAIIYSVEFSLVMRDDFSINVFHSKAEIRGIGGFRISWWFVRSK